MTEPADAGLLGSLEKLGFVPLADLARAAASSGAPDETDSKPAAARLRHLCAVYNAAPRPRQAIAAAVAAGDRPAALLADFMAAAGLVAPPVQTLGAERARLLETRLLADPAGFMTSGQPVYPVSAGDRHFGIATDWIAARLASAGPRWQRFVAERRRQTAVLVGNGPSLRQTDLGALTGQEVYVANYALNDPVLAAAARGVAVTNYFVADQAPHLFNAFDGWRVLPAWLSPVLGDSERTLWLHAVGGPLFFGREPLGILAWHATVSYFWLQVLFHAGYRRVLLIGFDNSYQQPEAVREGTLLDQKGDDLNHFDPGYFRGKVWQAADTDHMARTYRLSDRHYRADGREIVNCTVGGALEVFRRGDLRAELARAP